MQGFRGIRLELKERPVFRTPDESKCAATAQDLLLDSKPPVAPNLWAFSVKASIVNNGSRSSCPNQVNNRGKKA